MLYIAGIIRVTVLGGQGPGEVERTIWASIGPLPLPEGLYGALRYSIHRGQVLARRSPGGATWSSGGT